MPEDATELRPTNVDTMKSRCVSAEDPEKSALSSSSRDESVSERSQEGARHILGRKKRKRRDDDDGGCSKGPLIQLIIGVFLLLVAGLVFLLDPITRIVDSRSTIAEGTDAYRIWKEPPFPVYANIFIFNVTNPGEFLAGKEKLRVEEVGPYVFREVTEYTGVKFHANKTMSFMERRTLEYMPEKTERNPALDKVTVPNLPLLGFAAMVHQSSVWTNLGVNSLVTYLDSKPFVNLSVEELLWGYDDPILRLGNTVLPSWIHFDKLSFLNLMYDGVPDHVAMSLERPGLPSQLGQLSELTIDTFNWSPYLDQWRWPNGSVNRCSHIRGSGEGLVYPRNIDRNEILWLFRKAICRPVAVEFSHEDTYLGYPMYVYRIVNSSMECPAVNPENECYCYRHKGSCLPTGFIDISGCTNGFPVAISLPHFFMSEAGGVKEIDGLHPNEEKHNMLLQVQPDMGIPIGSHLRVQVNLVVPKTRYIPRAAPFNEMVLPIFWADVYLPDVSPDMHNLMTLVIFWVPVIRKVLVIAPAISGAILVLLRIVSWWRTKPPQQDNNSQTTRNLLLGTVPQEKQQNDIKDMDWRQLSPEGCDT